MSRSRRPTRRSVESFLRCVLEEDRWCDNRARVEIARRTTTCEPKM